METIFIVGIISIACCVLIYNLVPVFMAALGYQQTVVEVDTVLIVNRNYVSGRECDMSEEPKSVKCSHIIWVKEKE